MLKELQSIANQGIDTNRDLYPIYQSAVEELARDESLNLPLPYLPPLSLGDPIAIGKAISGALLWVLVLIAGVSSDVKKTGRFSGMTIAIAIVVAGIATVFAWVGSIIPTVINPWVNYIGFPLIQFGVVYLLSRRRKPLVAPDQVMQGER